jgi:glycosyltransferase involved in cell wall biosynthesis
MWVKSLTPIPFKMLSILIPIYNCDVTKLVHELNRQCEENKIIFEIICLDDSSSQEFRTLNFPLKNISSCKLYQLDENIGRAAIRNRLAHLAQYDYLYFLDCDSGIANKNLISNFISHLSPKKLVSGGRLYQNQPPDDKSYFLHWLWGSKRELFKAEIRMKDPVNHFLSNNFIIDKNSLLHFPFDESIVGYGYEDVYFAYQLQKNGIEILHIENPVIHEGLDKNQALLEKLNEAAQNLLRLKAQSKKGEREFIIKGKLIMLWNLFDIPVIRTITAIKAKYLLPFLRKKLLTKRPNLFWLDMYRLFLLFNKQNP